MSFRCSVAMLRCKSCLEFPSARLPRLLLCPYVEMHVCHRFASIILSWFLQPGIDQHEQFDLSDDIIVKRTSIDRGAARKVRFDLQGHPLRDRKWFPIPVTIWGIPTRPLLCVI
jgi:hypothetical protein